ncbi:MAG: metal ABC transporter ATP-binding protein [Ignavibacteria bacterium]|jgi:zinc transport system ATP-binding protein|nr:metal ABC transporter ATP-binding protein [Ignavibacteria bacterium]
MILQFNNVSYAIHNTAILQNISFEVDAGDFLSIVGPNGSGKTTLLKFIIGAKSNYSGDIVFNEKPIIGYVPQVKTLQKSFPATALELVVNGITSKWKFRISKENKANALELLEQLNIAHVASQQLCELSGGELQRIYLARAIVRKPQILLLDEPATGVDLVCEKDMNELIDTLHTEMKTTIIMVTHDWSSAYHHSNKLLLLNKEMVFFGTPSDGFTDTNLARTFSNMSDHHNVTFGLKQ